MSGKHSTFPQPSANLWLRSVSLVGPKPTWLRIAAHTLRTWGEDQTIRYIDDLEACCLMLGDNPTLGRECDDVRPGLRRMERGRHVIFYREDAGGILVSRILHQRMLPERHAMEDDDGP